MKLLIYIIKKLEELNERSLNRKIIKALQNHKTNIFTRKHQGHLKCETKSCIL